MAMHWSCRTQSVLMEEWMDTSGSKVRANGDSIAWTSGGGEELNGRQTGRQAHRRRGVGVERQTYVP